MRSSLAGRVAVVTGASSGIGLATATELASAGARVVLVARSASRLRAAADVVAREAQGSAAPLGLPCDVSDPEAVVTLADRVRREAGTPDIVVNNAGIGHWAPVVEMSLERIRAVLEVNLFGAIHCTKAFLPGMLDRRHGTLVFVSSGFGELSFPYSAAYCASKHALNGFAGALRAEVEPLGVRVLLALPGRTDTAFFETNAYPSEMLARYLLQRPTAPKRVAQCIVRAVVHGRRRVVMGRFNDLGLRLLGAVPELEDRFLSLIGRRLVRRERSSAAAPRDVR
jgi:short-subunit dehydrogenase